MGYITDLPPEAVRLIGQGKKPTVRYYDKGMEATDQWYVPFGLLTPFRRAVGGVVESIGGLMNRVVPLRFAEFPSCIAYDCQTDYVGWDAAAGTFKGVMARIAYRTPPYPVDGTDAFMTIGTQAQNFPINAPAGLLSGAGGRVSSDGGGTVGGMTFRIELHKLASFDPASYSAIGTVVNQNAWRGFAPGTVKFEGPSGTRTVSFNGVATWEASLPFQVRFVPWNYFWTDGGTLEEVTYNGSFYYPKVDFASVFGF